ncbi:antibiotic biosynthesis monooxygenase family protein [Sorangium sp. So ce1024]|uniref:antibiotic biosynthesis monooxygenase family protein n=1 Tax=Sorangium sp. So ce1024 TaxID=3133327 RepID=UPI003F03D0EF
MTTRTLNLASTASTASSETSARPSRAIAAALLAALAGILPGCGSDSGAATPQDSTPECTGGVLEADLQADPLSGPGVDPATGELRPPPEGSSYTISSTYGIPRSGDAVMERYVQLFGAIQTQLASQRGLVAIQLAQSPSCGSGRTLAVWESTEAMYEFVMSPAHLEAMNAADELLQPNYAVTHWQTARADEMTLQEGVRRIKTSEAAAR